MNLTTLDLDSLAGIAEKAKKALEHLTTLKEIVEKSKTAGTPILITKKEATQLLQISPSHLAVLRHRGTGPRYIKMGGSIYYDVCDIFDYIENSKKQSTSDQ